MANPLSKLIHPWYPANAIGLEKGLLTMVQLERGKSANPNSGGGEQGVTDVHSASSDVSSEGTPYSEW